MLQEAPQDFPQGPQSSQSAPTPSRGTHCEQLFLLGVCMWLNCMACGV